MSKDELRAAIIAVMEDYLADDIVYGDNTLIEIDPVTGAVTLVSGDDISDMDDNGKDYYEAMELVVMDSANQGKWLLDAEALEALVAEY